MWQPATVKAKLVRQVLVRRKVSSSAGVVRRRADYCLQNPTRTPLVKPAIFVSSWWELGGWSFPGGVRMCTGAGEAEKQEGGEAAERGALQPLPGLLLCSVVICQLAVAFLPSQDPCGLQLQGGL